MSKFQIVSHSPTQTKKIAKLLADELRGEEIICLVGSLGGGKTTFIKGLAKGLGIKQPITSPSFVLIKRYKIPALSHQLSAISYMYHIDCYRISNPQEMLNLGLEEILSQKKSVFVIEWADRITGILPKERLNVKFKYIDKNKRKISFSKD